MFSGPDGVYSAVQRHWQNCARLALLPSILIGDPVKTNNAKDDSN